MTTEASDYWNTHSETFLKMAFSYDHKEIPARPDGYGKRVGDCGDSVEIFLTIRNDRIAQVAYDIEGCVNTRACCNALVRLIEGKTVETAWQITPEDIADFLETLPADHFHCAELTVGTLYQALNDYRQLQKAPWKKQFPVTPA